MHPTAIQSEILKKILRTRITQKVTCHPEENLNTLPSEIEASNRKRVQESVETAGWAPFHYARGVDGIAEPWRAHILWRKEAHDAAKYMHETLQVKTKEPLLAAACSALVLVTWLPEWVGEGEEGQSNELAEKLQARNEEHLAASAAMVQSLLLMLTAHGMGNYWSSGGRFRSSEMFEYFNIPKSERLLAAVFIEYPEDQALNSDCRETKPGAQRGNRSQNLIRVVSH